MDETAKDSTQSEVYGFPLSPAASLLESFDGTWINESTFQLSGGNIDTRRLFVAAQRLSLRSPMFPGEGHKPTLYQFPVRKATEVRGGWHLIFNIQGKRIIMSAESAAFDFIFSQN